jgi:hypothetical protein
MRQKIRKTITLISLLLFPITLNYLSPYVSIDGAFQGILAGSVLVFLFLFISGLFFRRAWCSWVCPVSGLSDYCTAINNKPVPAKKLRVIRYTIFTIWFSVLVTGFLLAGGVKTINPFHLTEHIVSVDEPIRYPMYYFILIVLITFTILIGKRGACHTLCWMSPFLTGGYLLGKVLHLPQLGMKTNPSACIDCKKCNQKCPMSIDVNKEIKAGEIKSSDCILCGECADTCPKKVLTYGFRKK